MSQNLLHFHTLRDDCLRALAADLVMQVQATLAQQSRAALILPGGSSPQALLPRVRALFGRSRAEENGPEPQALIEAAGAELRYLPPYSPDFNPIENAFAKLEALLRKAAERTIGGLWDTIGRIIDLFPPAECANYFSAAGYDAT